MSGGGNTQTTLMSPGHHVNEITVVCSMGGARNRRLEDNVAANRQKPTETRENNENRCAGQIQLLCSSKTRNVVTRGHSSTKNISLGR